MNWALSPTLIDTMATVALQKADLGFEIAAVHLDVTARVPGMDATTFAKAAARAKEGCPVSRVLKVPITLQAQLVG